MVFFDKIFKQLFSQKNEVSNVKTPFITEQIVRTKKYKNEYFKWLNEGNSKQSLELIQKCYQNKKAFELGEIDIHLFQSAYANGFAITYNPAFFSSQDFHFLFDLLKDRVLPMGYRKTIAERKIYDRATFVETIEKYYLKPQMPQDKEGLFNQLYGNVLLELVLINDKPSYIKVLVSLYSDRLYTKALPFKEFQETLFS